MSTWTFNRVSVAITAVAAAVLCAIGVTEGDAVLVGSTGIAAIAFAAGLRPPASRLLRGAAFGLQLLVFLTMMVTLVAVLSTAEAGPRNMPVWFWVVVIATFFIVGKAVVEGYRVYKVG